MHKALIRETRRLKRAARKAANNRHKRNVQRALKAVIKAHDTAVNNAK